MDQIRIRNLRGLKDTGDIDVKPLTILVGKNSSGKSTFLRFFPLMKQTLSTKKNEPILWYSKESVDFGSFNESLNKNSKDKVIGFDFKFKISESSRLRNLQADNVPISLSVDLTEKSLKRISFTIFDYKIDFIENLDGYNLSINDQEMEHSFAIYRPNVLEKFLPRFVLKTNEINVETNTNNRQITVIEYFRELIYERIIQKSESTDDKEYQSELRKDIKLFIQELTFKHLQVVASTDRSLIDKIGHELYSHQYIDDFFYINNEELEDTEESVENENLEENKLLEILKSSNDEEYKEINKLLLGSYISKLFDINEYLNSYFMQVHYIAPLRASAQRYYRLQGLAVDEIDPQGENIPMAINQLSSFKKTKFKSWMRLNFGFEIETKVSGGHVTLNISFDNNESLNLADTGFGFSQILPILLLLWRVENNDFNINTRMARWIRYFNTHNIVIEQPELHLHPALQARLTDALVKCIKKARENELMSLNIIIETHSETIVNRVGQLVYKEKINKELINVLIFGNLENSNSSEECLTSVSFNEEGTIKNWPLGFFYPEV